MIHRRFGNKRPLSEEFIKHYKKKENFFVLGDAIKIECCHMLQILRLWLGMLPDSCCEMVAFPRRKRMIHTVLAERKTQKCNCPTEK